MYDACVLAYVWCVSEQPGEEKPQRKAGPYPIVKETHPPVDFIPQETGGRWYVLQESVRVRFVSYTQRGCSESARLSHVPLPPPRIPSPFAHHQAPPSSALLSAGPAILGPFSESPGYTVNRPSTFVRCLQGVRLWAASWGGEWAAEEREAEPST